MHAIVMPVLAMMILTLLVWLTMFVRRVVAIQKLQVPQDNLATPEKLTASLDDYTNAPANCFKNLFEVPVVFYALCAFLAITSSVDALFVNLAWGFVALRAIQALVHCTYNHVMHRFYAYLASCALLWTMVIRFLLQMT